MCADPLNIPPIIREALEVVQEALPPDVNIFDHLEVVAYRTESDISAFNQARNAVISEFFDKQSADF